MAAPRHRAAVASGTARTVAKPPQTNKPTQPVTEKVAGGRIRVSLPNLTGSGFPEGVLWRQHHAPVWPRPPLALPSRGPQAPQSLSIPVSSFICCLLLN